VQLPGAERKENRELKSSRLEEFRPLSRRRLLTSFRQAGWRSLGTGPAPRAGRLASLAQARRSPATLYPTIPGRLTRLAGASGFMISFRSSRLSDILSMWSPSHGFLTSFRSPISLAFCVGFKVTL
jgi:hypothetical protein